MANQHRLTSVYIAAATIAFMVCGANSDLFGRRYFIIGGNILVFVGGVVGATSHHISQSIVAHVLIGFGAGNCQLATFAIPELLPNKWRHIGVVIADGVAFFEVIAGPVTSRIAISHGDAVSDIPLILAHQLIRDSGAGVTGPWLYPSLSLSSFSHCYISLQSTREAFRGAKLSDIWTTLAS